MAKINLLSDLATEAVLRRVEKALNFAKDSAQRMRVVVEGTATTVGSTYWANVNSQAVYYSTGAPNSMDAREQQRLASVQNAAIQRQRWTIT